MNGLAARGRRVAGMVVSMLGAGLILESQLCVAGLAIMLAGLAVFVSGFLGGRTARSRSEEMTL